MFKRLFIKKSDKVAIHLFRSILSSNIAFSVDFGILVLLTEAFHIHYLLSNGIGFITGTTVSYILSVLWVFNRRSVQSRHLEYWIFIFIGVVGVGLNEALIWFFTEHAAVYYLYSKIIAGCMVFFWNFFTRKVLLFR